MAAPSRRHLLQKVQEEPVDDDLRPYVVIVAGG